MLAQMTAVRTHWRALTALCIAFTSCRNVIQPSLMESLCSSVASVPKPLADVQATNAQHSPHPAFLSCHSSCSG